MAIRPLLMAVMGELEATGADSWKGLLAVEPSQRV